MSNFTKSRSTVLICSTIPKILPPIACSWVNFSTGKWKILTNTNYSDYNKVVIIRTQYMRTRFLVGTGKSNKATAVARRCRKATGLSKRDRRVHLLLTLPDRRHIMRSRTQAWFQLFLLFPFNSVFSPAVLLLFCVKI